MDMYFYGQAPEFSLDPQYKKVNKHYSKTF